MYSRNLEVIKHFVIQLSSNSKGVRLSINNQDKAEQSKLHLATREGEK